MSTMEFYGNTFLNHFEPHGKRRQHLLVPLLHLVLPLLVPRLAILDAEVAMQSALRRLPGFACAVQLVSGVGARSSCGWRLFDK